MAGILDWLLGGQQPQPMLDPSQGQPQMQQGQPQQGGILNRMGDALIGMGDPYGMMDKSAMDPRARQQMIGQALLNFGTGVSSSKERSPFAAIGQGFQYAQQQGQQQGDSRVKGLMYKAQLGDMDTKNKTKQYLLSRPKPAAFGGTDDDWKLFANSNPAEAFKMVSERPDPNKLITYGPDGQPVVNQTYLNAQKDIRAAGKTSVVNNVEVKGETEFSKVAGKKDAERFDSLVEAGRTAKEFSANLGALTQIATKFEPGKMAEWKSAAGPYLQALGVDVKDLGAIQSYEAIVDRMAPAMRVPGSGATSDFEMRKFLSALPSLGRTAEGNATVSAVLGGIMQQRQQAAAIANQALTGKISRQEANERIQALPDPLEAWRAAQKVGLGSPAPAATGTRLRFDAQGNPIK